MPNDIKLAVIARPVRRLVVAISLLRGGFPRVLKHPRNDRCFLTECHWALLYYNGKLFVLDHDVSVCRNIFKDKEHIRFGYGNASVGRATGAAMQEKG